MKKILAHTAAVAVFGLAAAAAQAGINLPTNLSQAVRFDGGPMVFDTLADPVYDQGRDAVTFSKPVVLAAFGDLINIVNADTSLPGAADRGGPAAGSQLTYVFAGQLANIEIDAKASNSLSTVKKSFHITADLVGVGGQGAAQLVLFDKDITAGPAFDTQSMIGKNHAAAPNDPASLLAGVSGNATSYLEFNNIQSGTVSIDVTFERVGGSSTFNKRTITVALFGAEDFPITGGTAASLFTGGIGFTGNQHLKQVTQVASGSTVGDVNNWVEGNFALTVSRVVPEPASLALVGMGALMIAYRGRRDRSEA